MAKDRDDIGRQIDFALDGLFSATDDMEESLNYVGDLSKLLRPSEARATLDQKAYVFIEKSWARVNSVVREAEARRGVKSYDDLPPDLASPITLVIGAWQSLLRYHPRGDMVHRACVDIINRSDSVMLGRFVWFLDRVNRSAEFIDPQVIKRARERLSKY